MAQNYQSYATTADIYCLFYERGAQLLKTGEHLCFITSNKWMRAGYSDKLRAFLSSTVTLLEILVVYIQFVKAAPNQSISNGTPAAVIAAFLQELIDACVMEIYFAEHDLQIVHIPRFQASAPRKPDMTFPTRTC